MTDGVGRATRGSSICAQCGGDCECAPITLALRHARFSFAILRNVPAEVCQYCGDSQFTLATTTRVLAHLQASRQPDDLAVVPVFDLSGTE